MKIGLVLDTTLDSDAGVQQYFKGIARYFLKNGHEVRFLVPPSPKSQKGEFKGKIYSFGFNLTFKGNANTVPVGFYFGTRKLNKVLKQENFDILHAGAPYSPLLSGKAIRKAKCPVVVSYLIYGKNKFLNKLYSKLTWFIRPSLNKIDKFLAVSDASKKEAESMIDEDFDIVSIGINFDRFSPEVKSIEEFEDEKKNILFLGRLEKRKGVLDLLKAFEIVKGDLEGIRLIIAGDGPQKKELENYKRRRNIRNVVFTGYIKEQLKPNYYASADVCVFPALFGECFGVVLIESMASGKVTIGYANEGYSYVLNGMDKLLVEPGNVKDLANRLKAFLTDSDMKKEYEEKCLERVKNFSWQQVGKQLDKIYQDLISK